MNTSAAPTLPVLGAYALLADGVDEAELHRAVQDLPIGGLEVPLHGENAPAAVPLRRPEVLPAAWDLVLTCIPVVMGRLDASDGYGLSATDDDGRAAALTDVARAVAAARDLAERYGRQRVAAIEIHSAPGPRAGSTDAFARSLEQLLGYGDSPELLVEHCDAHREGQRQAKGFWSLADEIEAVELVSPGGPPAGLGVSVNWGRSAIEGRDAATPVEHLTLARDAGLLRGLVFSGACATDTAWGPAWSDAHIPPRGPAAALAPSAASLLDATAVAAAMVAAGPGVLLGVKVSVRPVGASVADRVAVAAAALDQVAAARR